jgi:small subunit ribosomal protein S17
MADQEHPETNDTTESTERAYEAAASDDAGTEAAAPAEEAVAEAAAPGEEPAGAEAAAAPVEAAAPAAQAAAPEPAAQPDAAPAASAAPQAPPSTPKERKVAARERRGKRRPATPDERAELRRQKAAARSRRRAAVRAKRGDAKGEGTPPSDHGPGAAKVRLGKVVSDKADKTITVRIDVARRHRRYQKIVRSTTTLHAHDERNDAHEGDLVRVVESRPMSATKRWRLVEILERAK